MGELVGFDKVIYELNKGLKVRLSWLTTAYAKADILLRSSNGRNVKYPAIYNGYNEYVSVLPDDNLGNFSFVLVTDPKEYSKQDRSISANVSIIFWYNLDTIFFDNKKRYTEEVNMGIISALNSITYSCGSFVIENIQEDGKNIYKELDYSEVSNQYRMQPYAGVRINGVLTYIDM